MPKALCYQARMSRLGELRIAEAFVNSADVWVWLVATSERLIEIEL